ncbi:MAG: hypothetical protein BWX93_01982 [Bacteroidetes bacterium ADurb.Bin139]|nr:MAG: hypothetical protein BWX93_01982 [Bacteroidetes bacterium ADurb.Bin139]
MGVRVSAAMVETELMIATIQPSWLKISPDMPPTIVRGIKTASNVRVEAMIDMDTSLVA